MEIDFSSYAFNFQTLSKIIYCSDDRIELCKKDEKMNLSIEHIERA